MRHQSSEARGPRAGVEGFAEFLKACFDAAPIGSWNEGKQMANFLTRFFDWALKFLEAGDAGGCFQFPRDQFHELAVGFRAQFNEFRAFRPHILVPAS
jgi:hypothetical protein